MIIRRTPFFLWLFVIAITPFFVYKFVWLARSEKVNGIMQFAGKSRTGQLEHVYAVISFMVGKDTVWFNGNDNILFKEGETVPVRYQKHNPSDARIDIFASMWGDTLVYSGIPVAILLVLFLHPFIIPYSSRLRLTKQKPYILIV